jgi:exopolysaccharide biosynthesis predicted pyruvyltransferase EpsI
MMPTMLPKNYTKPKGISPINSTAPTKIDLLFQTNSTNSNPSAIQKRHECIAKIRLRFYETMRPHIKSYAQQKNRPALVVDPAFHANVGDHMIYVAEREFLENALGFIRVDTDANDKNDSADQPPVEICNYAQASFFAKKCTALLKTKDPSKVAGSIAYWHGGGNWGDLWPSIQDQRMLSFESLLLANFSVVGIPQSFHYDSDEKRAIDTELMKASIARGLGLESSSLPDMKAVQHSAGSLSRVTLAWREVESFEMARQEYPFVTHLLVPDVAFHLGPFNPIPSPQKDKYQLDILMFLREDKESMFAKKRNQRYIRGLLDSIVGGSDLTFGIADWNTRFALWPSDDYLFTDSAIKLLSLGKVVICDRLHASILCYLTGIP